MNAGADDPGVVEQTCPQCGNPQARLLGGAFVMRGVHSVRYRCLACRHQFSITTTRATPPPRWRVHLIGQWMLVAVSFHRESGPMAVLVEVDEVRFDGPTGAFDSIVTHAGRRVVASRIVLHESPELERFLLRWVPAPAVLTS